VGFLSRLLLLAGACAMAVSVLLTWVTVTGPSVALDLDLIGARVEPGALVVNGIDTSLWPVIAGVAALVALLAVLGVARRLLVVVGLLVAAGGGALLYYVSNVVEIEANGEGPIATLLADSLISSAAGPGPPLLLAGGIVIVIGALLAR
jgi:hypothetical protein